MDTEETPKVDLTSLGSFDFTPDWAKKDAGVTVAKAVSSRGFDDRKPRGDRPQGAQGRGGFGGGDRKKFGDRKPSDSVRKPSGDRSRAFDRRPRFEDRPRPLDADVKILPEPKALGTIIRKLQQDFHAYKLKDLAYFLLDNPASVLLKVTAKAPKQGEAPKALGFHQCKACGFAALDGAEVAAHAVAAHLSDYYDVKEIEVEPPKGNFNCVAKCGLSGVLLGPPNIHEFNATVREMIRTRYPDMTEEQYRSHIEMVRDAEAVEEWRKGATKKTVFLPKGAGEGVAPLTREQAEGEFRRTILPQLLDTPKHLMITLDAAMKSPCRPLQWAARNAVEAERRAPYNMCFALRGAFHHRKLNFFRANDPRGPEFVVGTELKEFDAGHAIPELAKVAKFIAENPCSSVQEIAPDAESGKHLQWLVATGHVVAFTNGVYSAVEKFPKYGPQWRKKKQSPAPEKAAEPAPEKAAEPAPEPVPEKAEETAPEMTEKKEEVIKNEDTTELA